MDSPKKHEYTDNIICPYCGYEFDESGEYLQGGSGVIPCERCDRVFRLTVDMTVEYTTQADCTAEERCHTWLPVYNTYKSNEFWIYYYRCRDCNAERLRYHGFDHESIGVDYIDRWEG